MGNPIKRLQEKRIDILHKRKKKATVSGNMAKKEKLDSKITKLRGNSLDKDDFTMKKGGATKSLPKAQLGSIVKNTLKGAVKGGKTAYKATKTAQLEKRAAAAKKAKGYGESGQYARLEDMKRSEFYRDRHNAGKTYSSGDDGTKAKLIGMGIVGAASAAGVVANSKEANAKKVSDNAKKVADNAAKVSANAKKVAANKAKYKK